MPILTYLPISYSPVSECGIKCGIVDGLCKIGVGVLLCCGSLHVFESIYHLQVNRNGALQLGSDSGTEEKFIAPFFGDTDSSSGGSVFHRSTSNSSLVQHVSNIVTANFAGTTGLTLSSLFIATWFQVPANGQPANQVSGGRSRV